MQLRDEKGDGVYGAPADSAPAGVARRLSHSGSIVFGGGGFAGLDGGGDGAADIKLLTLSATCPAPVGPLAF